jgi:cytochrome c biogenesis protein CcmG, thiol:disulfide interchange protein DsbE
MSRNLRMGLLLAAGIFLMAGSTFLVWRAGRVTQTVQAPTDPPVLRFASNPEPAPRLVIHDLAGKVTSMDELKGKVVLVNFWATWCPPCRAETPAFVAAHKQWGDDVAIIGVDVMETPDMAPPFMNEFGITYPIAVDEIGEVTVAYRVVAYPTTFFIDSDGIIIQIDSGPLNEALLQTRLTDMIGR